MDNWRAGSCHGETAFGEFMSRHLKAIMCGVIAMPFVIVLFTRDTGEPTRTVWIADSAELSAFEARTGYILDALGGGRAAKMEDILPEAPSADLRRFDAYRIDLVSGYPAKGEMRRRVEALNAARDRVRILAADGAGSKPDGNLVASGSAP
jgi:hypothetical protein